MAATPGNALNVSSAGIIVFDGTATFSADTTTNHNVLLGAASNGITNVAPSTSGFVLTSNGASADPSFQANPGSFSPNATIDLSDDFIAALNATGSLQSQLGWLTRSTNPIGYASATQLSTHPGIVASPSITLGGSYLLSAYASEILVFGGGAITLNWVINVATLSTGTNTYTLYVGFGDTGGGEPSNGAYFLYSSGTNSGNWVLKTAAGGVRTTTNTATAVGTGWINLGVTVNAAASSVGFTINGVSAGTIATNIPTLATNFYIDIARSAGTIAAGSLEVDLVYYTQTLTAAR